MSEELTIKVSRNAAHYLAGHTLMDLRRVPEYQREVEAAAQAAFASSTAPDDSQVTVNREDLEWVLGFITNLGPRRGSVLEAYVDRLNAALDSLGEGG